MVDVVKVSGLSGEDFEQVNVNAGIEDVVVGSSEMSTNFYDSCVSATCQMAKKLGLSDDIAATITREGIAAYKHGAPPEKAVLYKISSQLSALYILDDEYDLALLFTTQNKVNALELVGKAGAGVAHQVSSSAQVEAMRLMIELGINISRALSVLNYEEVLKLQLFKKGSVSVKAVDAGAPIDRAAEFELDTQVEALTLVDDVSTALKFRDMPPVYALKKYPNLPVATALSTTEVIWEADGSGMPRVCAWQVTNQCQIDAYKEINRTRLSVADICATALSFNASHQVVVLNKTGDLELSLTFHNTYAQQALDANVDPTTARFVDNEHALKVVLKHSVQGSLAAKFTTWVQVHAVESGLMSTDEAADASWWDIRFKMGVAKNVHDVGEYCATWVPHYRETAFVVGTAVIGGLAMYGIWHGAAILTWLGLKAAKNTAKVVRAVGPAAAEASASAVKKVRKVVAEGADSMADSAAKRQAEQAARKESEAHAAAAASTEFRKAANARLVSRRLARQSVAPLSGMEVYSGVTEPASPTSILHASTEPYDLSDLGVSPATQGVSSYSEEVDF